MGSRRFAETLRWANPLSENGGESYARAIMLENGVAEPVLQVEFPDRFNPGAIFRIDYFWELLNKIDVGGELDGLEKTVDEDMLGGKTAAEVLRRERERESRLSVDLQIARFTFPEVRAVSPLINVLDAFGVPRGIPDAGLTMLRDPLAPFNRSNPYAMLR